MTETKLEFSLQNDPIEFQTKYSRFFSAYFCPLCIYIHLFFCLFLGHCRVLTGLTAFAKPAGTIGHVSWNFPGITSNSRGPISNTKDATERLCRKTWTNWRNASARPSWMKKYPSLCSTRFPIISRLHEKCFMIGWTS